MTKEIKKLETGLFIALVDGNRVGGITTNHGDGAIAQHGARASYTATFAPVPSAEGFVFTGTLQACKKWLTNWMEVLCME